MDFSLDWWINSSNKTDRDQRGIKTCLQEQSINIKKNILTLPALWSSVIECEGPQARRSKRPKAAGQQFERKRNHVKAVRAWHKVCGVMKQKLTFSLCYVRQNLATHSSSFFYHHPTVMHAGGSIGFRLGGFSVAGAEGARDKYTTENRFYIVDMIQVQSGYSVYVTNRTTQ